jgi:NADH-quinone oxidoreductase subunit C
MPGTAADRAALEGALAALAGRFPGAVSVAAGEEASLRVRPDVLAAVLRSLKEEAGLNALEDIAVFDNLLAPVESGLRFTVVYRLCRVPGRIRARVETDVGEDMSLASAVPVFRSAEWAEREAFDMFGVRFEGHPDLRRIYLADDFEGHPLRKDFPLDGRTGGA